MLQDAKAKMDGFKAEAEACLAKFVKEAKALRASKLGAIRRQLDAKLAALEEARRQFEATVQRLWAEFCAAHAQLEPTKKASLSPGRFGCKTIFSE